MPALAEERLVASGDPDQFPIVEAELPERNREFKVRLEDVHNKGDVLSAQMSDMCRELGEAKHLDKNVTLELLEKNKNEM